MRGGPSSGSLLPRLFVPRLGRRDPFVLREKAEVMGERKTSLVTKHKLNQLSDLYTKVGVPVSGEFTGPDGCKALITIGVTTGTMTAEQIETNKPTNGRGEWDNI